ncbi:hypothetical protein HZA57_05030 [Candidatus Poribacteria bacterium]|nr:hypothetical protein [Candidatus Poribacteria bacterium]
MSTLPSTRITHISWGKVAVATGGQTLAFRDCKVWPGGAVEWDWNLTGTHHRPGIQPADIAEILSQEVECIVLSRGMDLVLHICPETEALLQERGIEYRIEETRAAVALFNS